MSTSSTLFNKNTNWASHIQSNTPDYFSELSKGQSPHTFYIGCCDSRVPIEVVTQAEPGELFVYRNIANQADTTSDSFLAALDYAINVLGVKTIMVCGHTHCGGVNAALSDASDEQLKDSSVHRFVEPIRHTRRQHASSFKTTESSAENIEVLAKLNVQTQVKNITSSTIYQTALSKGKAPDIIGNLFRIETGTLETV